MNLLFGERAMAELVGKLRVLTACESCKKSFNETFIAISCNHYLCRNCVPPTKDECTKCKKSGEILRAQYFDPISGTLLKLKQLFLEQETLKPTANKRKADNIILTPTSKVSKVAGTPSTDTPKSTNALIVFAKKSRPSLADGCDEQRSVSLSSRMSGKSSSNPSELICSSEEVLLGSAFRSKSTTDSPVIQTQIDKPSAYSCSCGNRQLLPARQRGSADFGVQVSNNVLTLDVAVHAKASTVEVGLQTDGPDGNSKNALVSNETQTERPYVAVKRYFEVSVQTDEHFEHKSCSQVSCEPEPKSLTSTQAALSANQTVHAQPISLDMSPIRKLKVAPNVNENRSMNSAEKDAEDTMDFSTDDIIQKNSVINRADDTRRSLTKDTLDSLDFRTIDLNEAKRKHGDEGPPTICRRSPEPDSLDSIPSEMFINSERTVDERVKQKSQPNEKDTLESFFKSSEEVSIPETEPTAGFNKSKRALARAQPDSPLRLTEKRRTFIVSDDDEPISKKCTGENKRKTRAVLQSRITTKAKGGKQSKESNVSKSLPTFSSDDDDDNDNDDDDDDDDDDIEPLPMDTEDMRNLEKEIENLDREMEDSKGYAKSRFV